MLMNFHMGRIIRLGMINIWRHRMRSILTVLGIVLGVSSVIAMLAIGEGASYEAQEQIKKLGSQNIIIRSVKPPSTEEVGQSNTFYTEYGITYEDAERIQVTIPSVDVMVPQRKIRSELSYKRKQADGNVIGTMPWHPKITNQKVMMGRFFTDLEYEGRKSVCVIGIGLAQKLFSYQYPIGEIVKVKDNYFKIVGIIDDTSQAASSETQAGLYNIYIPLSAAKSRFGEIISNRSSGSSSNEKVELHELIIRVSDLNLVESTSEVIRYTLDKFHKKSDFEIIVPLELLRQARQTERIFSIVLGSIAAISLLVGGIGIMNIMLATVTERTREIGIRRALGAKKKDIVIQFLTETILLSGSGGLIGLVLGISTPFLITYFAGMLTIIKLWSLVGAFGISLLIGIIFGIYPAWRAAQMNPITALRHE